MPNYVSSKIQLNLSVIETLDRASIAALELTAEALHTDVVDAGVMPFDTGNMQNAQTYVDTSDSINGHVFLVTSSPQARRLYFHPEYDFRKENNAHAGGMWLEPWISGTRKDFCQRTYEKFFKAVSGK